MVPLTALQVAWLLNRSQKRGRPPPLNDLEDTQLNTIDS